jgi:hypothetical protein
MAVTCDRAMVREGLLHILGAGVTNTKMRLPSQLLMDVALMLQLDAADGGSHSISLLLTHEDTGERIGQVKGQFLVPEDELAQDELPLPYIPLPIPLSGFVVAKSGFYAITVTLDDKELTVLRIRVLEADDNSENF